MYEEKTDPLKAFFEESAAEFSDKTGIKTRPVPYDKHYKRRINRFLRSIGLKKIPYPDADNLYERLAGKFEHFLYSRRKKRL